MYLLDTDILSNLMKRAPASALVARVPPEEQFTSSVPLGELLYGAHRSSRTAALLERIEQTPLEELSILPFDAAAARRYGELRAEFERRGTPRGDANTRVASIALSRGLTGVTGNERHFRRVPGLEIETWLKDRGPQGGANMAKKRERGNGDGDVWPRKSKQGKIRVSSSPRKRARR